MPRPITTLSASIIRALADTDHVVPAADVIANTASFIMDWPDLETAAAACMGGIKGGPPLAVSHCVLVYREALRELGRPDRIAERLRRLAIEAETRAAKAQTDADDYTRMAEGATARGNLALADPWRAQARACAAVAAGDRALAGRLNARAAELATVSEAA